MTNVGSLNVSTAASAPAQRAAPANASAELGKCESPLSDRVRCAHSKTPHGKAKIVGITNQIESIKAQAKRAEDPKSPTPTRLEACNDL